MEWLLLLKLETIMLLSGHLIFFGYLAYKVIRIELEVRKSERR